MFRPASSRPTSHIVTSQLQTNFAVVYSDKEANSRTPTPIPTPRQRAPTMIDKLDKSLLIELVRLQGELGEIGHTNAEEAFAHLHRRLGQVLHSDHSFLLIHLVDSPGSVEEPELISSRARTALIEAYGTDAEQRTRIGADWAASTPNVLDDPLVLRTSRGIGTHRTLTPREEVDEHTWRRSAVRSLMDETGMASRLLTTYPLDGSVEFTFGFDRPDGEGSFDEEHRHLLHAIFAHLSPLMRSFCQRRGFLPDQTALTPRERDVLEHLLGPWSEKEIADILGLSTSWLHEVVITIYRKFNVRSRAELMSKWL